ncbi:Uncharacterised protein [Mycobacteroides abscessus subsp. massiliense]|nr:Uncharacterised protein [Mycobacteroides abscessus subsp. massiliense]
MARTTGSATDNQYVTFDALRSGFNRLGNLQLAACALYGRRINDNGDFGRAAV